MGNICLFPHKTCHHHSPFFRWSTALCSIKGIDFARQDTETLKVPLYIDDIKMGTILGDIIITLDTFIPYQLDLVTCTIEDGINPCDIDINWDGLKQLTRT